MFHEPVLTNDALLTDIETADPGAGLALWWLGQGTFFIKSAAGRVLLDPYPAALPTRQSTKPNETPVQKPQLSLALSTLTSIDVVVSSRHDIDREKAKSFAAVFDANPKTAFVVPEIGRKALAEQLGCDPAWPWGLRGGESLSFGEITVLAVPNESNETDIKSKTLDCLDYVVWFGNIKIYYSGNSRSHTTIAEFLRPLAVDVALLPIQDRSAEHLSAGTLAGDEAAQLAHGIGARLALPYLHNTLSRNTQSLARFEDACRRLGQPYMPLHCGERLGVCPQ